MKTIQQLTQVSVGIMLQIKYLTEQITDEHYSGSLELLSGNTIAKHVRHVIEIYEELVNGYVSAHVNYDARKRNLLLEHNRMYTLQYIDALVNNFAVLQEDKSIELAATYGDNAPEVMVKTTVGRELAYNIEHAVHHMAIMQIATKHSFPYIVLPIDFGVAYSTQAYQKQYVHA